MMYSSDDMKAADVIQFALKKRERTQKSLAEELNIGHQTFSKKLVNDTLTAREFFAAINALGLTMTFSDRETGDEVKERKRGVMPRLSMVVDKVRYDTHKSDALCYTEPFDGWVMELYKDEQGRYFLAVGTVWEGSKPAILPCSDSDAIRFYEAHGEGDDKCLPGKDNA